MPNKVTDDQINLMVSQYQSGDTIDKVSKSLGVSTSTVIAHLESLGIPRRNRGRKPATLNHNKFDNLLDEEALYWAGFIAADGHINTKVKGTPRIEIGLGGIDIDHLGKFTEFLEAPGYKVHKYTRKSQNGGVSCCSVFIGSETITDRLTVLGVKGPELAKELSESRHFWRGLMDGDGSISKLIKYPSVTLSGRLYILDKYIEFLKTSLDIELNPYNNFSTTATKPTYRVGTTGKPAYRIVKFLYEDSLISLDRKKIRADEIIRKYSSHI